MEAESREKALHYFFAKVVEPLGFKFTPDVELVDFLLDQEVMLEGKHGIPFCPCQPLRHDRARRKSTRSASGVNLKPNGPTTLAKK